jgi:hypothetical protein
MKMKAIHLGLALLLLSLLAACQIDSRSDGQLRSGPEVISIENLATLPPIGHPGSIT